MRLATAQTFGATPGEFRDVYGECHGTTYCRTNGYVEGNWLVWLSSCGDSADPLTCSRFTGDLDIVVRDLDPFVGTDDDRWRARFVDGVRVSFGHVSGDGYVRGDYIEIEATAKRSPITAGPGGGTFHFWITSQ